MQGKDRGHCYSLLRNAIEEMLKAGVQLYQKSPAFLRKQIATSILYVFFVQISATVYSSHTDRMLSNNSVLLLGLISGLSGNFLEGFFLFFFFTKNEHDAEVDCDTYRVSRRKE